MNSSIPSVSRPDLKCPYYFIDTIAPSRRGMASLLLCEAVHLTEHCRASFAPWSGRCKTSLVALTPGHAYSMGCACSPNPSAGWSHQL